MHAFVKRKCLNALKCSLSLNFAQFEEHDQMIRVHGRHLAHVCVTKYC